MTSPSDKAGGALCRCGDFIEVGHDDVGAEFQLPGVVALVPMVRASLPRRRRSHLGGSLEQPGYGIAAIVEHPAEGYHHRIGMPAAEHTGPIGGDPVVRVDPHHQVLGVEAVGHLGDLRTSRAFTQSRHPT